MLFSFEVGRFRLSRSIQCSWGKYHASAQQSLLDLLPIRSKIIYKSRIIYTLLDHITFNLIYCVRSCASQSVFVPCDSLMIPAGLTYYNGPTTNTWHMKEVFSLVSLAGRMTGKVSDTSIGNHFLLRFMVSHQAHSVHGFRCSTCASPSLCLHW